MLLVADDTSDATVCVGCGAEPTVWGLFMLEEGRLAVCAWCAADDCQRDLERALADGNGVVRAVPWSVKRR